MADNDQQNFEWALKNGDIDQVKAIVDKVSCHSWAWIQDLDEDAILSDFYRGLLSHIMAISFTSCVCRFLSLLRVLSPHNKFYLKGLLTRKCLGYRLLFIKTQIPSDESSRTGQIIELFRWIKAVVINGFKTTNEPDVFRRWISTSNYDQAFVFLTQMTLLSLPIFTGLFI